MALMIPTHNPETGAPTGYYDLTAAVRYRPMGDKYAAPGQWLELHYTRQGRWARFQGSEWQGTRDGATYLTADAARDWLTSDYGGYTQAHADEIIRAHA